MAKQGQHHKDGNDQDVSRGPNKHSKSTPITTGSYRTPETTKKETYEHEDPAKRAQDHKPHWYKSTPRKLTRKDRFGAQRTGSESNESRKTRGW